MIVTFSGLHRRESYAMKFERLTVTHHQMSAGFQYDAPAIFGDDLDLVHSAEVAVEGIGELSANIIFQARRQNLGDIHSASFARLLPETPSAAPFINLKFPARSRTKTIWASPVLTSFFRRLLG